MAEIIEPFVSKHRAVYAVYPWDEWLDGQARRAFRGVDYFCEDKSLRVILFRKAKAIGTKVKVKVEHDSVCFQFTIPEAP